MVRVYGQPTKVDPKETTYANENPPGLLRGKQLILSRLSVRVNDSQKWEFN